MKNLRRYLVERESDGNDTATEYEIAVFESFDEVVYHFGEERAVQVVNQKQAEQGKREAKSASRERRRKAFKGLVVDADLQVHPRR
jgi:hypothetical protein